jgi:hypothetical protein
MDFAEIGSDQPKQHARERRFTAALSSTMASVSPRSTARFAPSTAANGLPFQVKVFRSAFASRTYSILDENVRTDRFVFAPFSTYRPKLENQEFRRT